MAVPVYVGASATSANGQGNFTVAVPAGTQAGDLLLLHLTANLSNANFGNLTMNTAGYTLVRTSSVSDASSGYVKIFTYSKIMTASDLSGGAQFFVPNTVNFTAFAHSFRGNNMTVINSGEVTQANVSGPVAIPTVASTRADQMYVVVSAVRNTGVTLTLPAGYTQHDSGGTCPGVTGRQTAVSTAAGQGMGNGNVTRSDTGATSAIAVQGILIAAGTVPNAPTGLTVTGTALPGGGLDRTKTIRATWTVSDADGNPQTSAACRYRVAGSLAPWTVALDSDATAFLDFPAGTFAGNVELAARTSDVDGDGPYSAVVTFYAGDPAGAASTVPGRLDAGIMLALIQAQRALAPAVAP